MIPSASPKPKSICNAPSSWSANSTPAHVNLGQALIHFDRFGEAEIHLRRALELDPDSIAAHVTLGDALVRFKRFDEAEVHLRRALKLDPGSVATHQNLAEALRKQRRSAEAIESYRVALEIDPGFAFAYADMGMALFDARQFTEALAALEQALELQPELAEGGLIHLLLGRSCARTAPVSRSPRITSQRAADLDPDNVEPLLDLAGVRRRQQRDREAEELLARARELRPRDPIGPPHRRRGAQNAGPRRGVDRRLPYGAGDPSGLRAVARRAGNRAVPDAALPRRTWSRCSGHWNWIPSCRWRPRCTCSWATRGPSWGTGRPQSEQFERALRIEPRHPEALDHLAMARFGQRRYEDALAMYRTLLEINPDNALTHSNVGAALLHLGRPQEALQSIERASGPGPGPGDRPHRPS